MGIADQSLLKDFSATAVGPAGDRIFEASGQFKSKDGEGRDEDGGISKMPQLGDGKVRLLMFFSFVEIIDFGNVLKPTAALVELHFS